jgi:hypothetical protein
MTYVRTTTGEKIQCCWDDCQNPGHDEIKLRQLHEDKQWWWYIFCSLRHKALYVNGHREYSRLEVGSGRGT